MAEASNPAPCPNGHGDTVKLLTTFSVGNRTGASGPLPLPSAATGGGCCGGACGCG